MYLMYVDESGDCGLAGSPTRYFILTGVVVHELRWRACLEEFLAFRKHMRDKHGLANEGRDPCGRLHHAPGPIAVSQASRAVGHSAGVCGPDRPHGRCEHHQCGHRQAGKRPAYNVFEMAWKVLLQRFENTLSRHNFTGPQNPDERGMISSGPHGRPQAAATPAPDAKVEPHPERIEYGLGYRNLLVNNIIGGPELPEIRTLVFHSGR
jgi:hypothetical protein